MAIALLQELNVANYTSTGGASSIFFHQSLILVLFHPPSLGNRQQLKEDADLHREEHRDHILLPKAYLDRPMQIKLDLTQTEEEISRCLYTIQESRANQFFFEWFDI